MLQGIVGRTRITRSSQRTVGERELVERFKRFAQHCAVFAATLEVLKKVRERRIKNLAFANNHYADHACGPVRLFSQLWGTHYGRRETLVRHCRSCIIRSGAEAASSEFWQKRKIPPPSSLDGRVGRRSPSEARNTSRSHELDGSTAEALGPVTRKGSKTTPILNDTG